MNKQNWVKHQLKELWIQKWWVLVFCIFIFIFSDYAGIRAGECGSSPCSDTPYFEASGLTFLNPIGFLSVRRFVPENYNERNDVLFSSNWFAYYLHTPAPVEHDFTDPSLRDREPDQASTNEDMESLAMMFMSHKLWVLLSIPWWIVLYWLIFVFSKKAIKNKVIKVIFYCSITLLALFLLFISLISHGISGGNADTTWQYIFSNDFQLFP